MTKIIDPIVLIIISTIHLYFNMFVVGYAGSALNLTLVICIGIIMLKMAVTMLKVTKDKNRGGKL